MIYDSSKDHFTGQIIIVWDNNRPTEREIQEYCHKNYGFIPSTKDIIVEDPSESHGYRNPGIIYIGKL